MIQISCVSGGAVQESGEGSSAPKESFYLACSMQKGCLSLVFSLLVVCEKQEKSGILVCKRVANNG